MLDFQTLTTLMIFHTILVFCRIGTVLMLFPGIAEGYVPMRVRLMVALAVAVAMASGLERALPPLPATGWDLIITVSKEVMIGLYIGALTRMVQATLHIAGMMIAFQSSLASAMLFDINQASQGSVVGNFLTLTGVVLLYVSGLHHVMLMGVAESYLFFPAGGALPTDALAGLASEVVSQSFLVAFKIAAPLMVVGLLVYLASGIMGRLMPTMQVFFVITPLQLYVSFVILLMTMSAGFHVYMEHMQDTLHLIYAR